MHAKRGAFPLKVVGRIPQHEKFFGIPTYVQVDDPDHLSVYTMFTLQMKLL